MTTQVPPTVAEVVKAVSWFERNIPSVLGWVRYAKSLVKR